MQPTPITRLACVSLVCAAAAQATPIVEDFNAYPGNERLLNTNYGTGWPEGYTPGSQVKWGEDVADGTTGGTSAILTTAGDLIAPASTGYNITQPVVTDARSVTGNGTSARRQSRYTGGLTGDVWLSWLMAPSADGRIGLNLNSGVKGFDGSENVRIIAVGSSFNVYGPGTNSKTGVFTAGQTVLVVGLLQMDASGTDDRLRLWVNPDVSRGAADLLAGQAPVHDLVLDNAIMKSRLDTIGIVAYSATSNPGRLDSLRLSNGAYGFSDVTGVVLDDGTPPTIVAPTVPANGATGVLATTAIRARFDEPIVLVDGGTVIIDDLDGGQDTLITLPDSRVSVSEADLVIDLGVPLAAGTGYAIKIGGNTIKDLAPVPSFFVGIADDVTWSFRTAGDVNGPVLVFPTSPADGSTDVGIDANLVAQFDEAIKAGIGSITIRNLTTATDTVIPVGDPRVSIAGSALTIDPASSFGTSGVHAVLIDAGAVTDLAGNPFAGIADPTIWNFTTEADKLVPVLVSQSPGNGSVAPLFSALVGKFSEPVMRPFLLRADFESGDAGFTVATSEGSDWEHGTPDSSSFGGTINSGNGAARGKGSCWGTNLGTYADGGGDPGYYESGGATGTITCLRSRPIDLSLVTGATLSFAQAFDLAPGDLAVVNLIDDTTDTLIAGAVYTAPGGGSGWEQVPPIDLAAGVGQVVRIEWCLTGSGGASSDYLGWYVDDVVVNASEVGGITLRNLSKGTETVFSVDDPEVRIEGNTLTLSPPSLLEAGDHYAVRIDADALTDRAGNLFGGILDDEAWHFTGGLAVIPAFDSIARPTTVPAIDPAHTGNLGIGPIQAGDYFRTYLTFDLSGETAAMGEASLRFSGSGFGTGENEGNTSSLPQVFTLYALAEDWAGAGQPFPLGTPLATAAFTPATGDDLQSLSFSSAALTAALNKAIGGNLHLAVASDAEGPANRSFKWVGSREDVGFEPLLVYLPDDGSSGGGGSFADWIASYPGLGGRTGINDDPDGDGNVNGVENFFGTHPGVFSAGLVTGTVNAGAGTFTFTHPQGTLASDLTASYSWSTDLVTFHADGASSGGTTVNFSTVPDPVAAGTPTTVTATVTGTPVRRLFVRVEVTRN